MSPMIQNPRRFAAEAMGRMRRLHFIGVGGAGMNGIAQVMLNLGYDVSGSDLRTNSATEDLCRQGAKIFEGHAAEQVRDVDAVVVSSAVQDDNPELVAARQARIPIVPRAEMLAEIMRFRYGIAVAGTHGKTTTTSLIASLLIEGGLDPTYVIGGRLNASGAHAGLGNGEVLVAEADESDASFLYYAPQVAVVTNIDADHMSTYGGDFERLKAAFVEFLHHLPFYGLAVLCIDDAEVRALLPEVTRPVLTYGTAAEADLQLLDMRQSGIQTTFRIRRDGQPVEFRLNLPGRHNVLNAMAAIAVAHELGVGDDAIRAALTGFQGIGRRFQVKQAALAGGGACLVIDDYGHHPRELEATVAAVRAGWPERRLLLVFQPHRYSRTRDAFDDFVRVLSTVDLLVLTEVYAAGELPIATADGRALSQALRTRGQIEPVFVEQVSDLPRVISGIVQPDDVVLVMGAGDIGAIAANLPKELGT